MSDTEQNIKLFKEKMRSAGIHELVIDLFLYYYAQLTSGENGCLPEADILPIKPGALTDYQNLSGYSKQGEEALKHAAIIKLNGGLGTTMGLESPKGMLPVKDDFSFLDISIKQVTVLNNRFNIKIPFILMNSFNTAVETGKILKKYPEIKTPLPSTFIQNKYPKIFQQSLQPASWPKRSAYEWNPPGHGDIYLSLFTSGILKQLLDADIYYAFISNIDNLGATMDCSLLGYFASHNIPFMMEAIARTPMDKKGGHLAIRKNDNRLILREMAQTPEQEIPLFQDITRHCYFNSNNLWINLKNLGEVLDRNRRLYLPLIVNRKNLIPKNKNTPPVFQLETAMGSAISLFPGSEAVMVPGKRFIPVKKCADLLIVWSDYYTFLENNEIILNPQRTLPPIVVHLDEKYYGTYHQMKERFAEPPSLLHCKSLSVEGDVRFGVNVRIKGEAAIKNRSGKQVFIQDGAVIEKEVDFYSCS